MQRMTQALCEEIIGGMKLTCPVFGNSIVQVNHEDGTSLTFRHALAWHCGNYLLVATEHNGYHYFHKDDLAAFGFYKSEKIAHIDEQGKSYTPAYCDECGSEVKAGELTLLDIPDEQIDLCPTCYDDFKAGRLDPSAFSSS